MNKFKIVVPILIFLISCEKKETLVLADNFSNLEKVSDTIQQIDTLLLGDLNSDKIQDTVFRICPKMINANLEEHYDGDCVNNICNVTFKFSFTKEEIIIEEAIGSGIKNISDIDKDGVSELAIYPYWYIGCWGKVYYYSLQNNKWKDFGFARANICDDSIYKNEIKILSKNKISVLEKFNIGGEAKFKRKTIKLK